MSKKLIDNDQLLSLIFFKESLHCPQAGFLPSNVRQILKLLDSGEGWGGWRAGEAGFFFSGTFGTLGYTVQSQDCFYRFLLTLQFSLQKPACILNLNIKSRKISRGVNIFHKPCQMPDPKSFQSGTQTKVRQFCREVHKPAISAGVQNEKDFRKTTISLCFFFSINCC